jgi:hypothetical protein
LEDALAMTVAGATMKLVNWDGKSPLPIVGHDDRVIAVGAPRPPIPDWDNIHERASKKIFDIRESYAFTDAGNRRGDFSSLNFGFSYGFGHTKPGNRKQKFPEHTAIIETVRADADIQILAAAASGEYQHILVVLVLHDFQTHLLVGHQICFENMEHTDSAYSTTTLSFESILRGAFGQQRPLTLVHGP